MLQEISARGSLFGELKLRWRLMNTNFSFDFVASLALNIDTVVFDKDALQANISWKSADLGGESFALIKRTW